MSGREREIRIRCPHCSALCSYGGEVDPDMVAFCGQCHGAITRELKRAFFKDVSSDISARLVEKENRDFFDYLKAGWRDRQGEDRS